jgi:hypothetical protein
MHCPTPTTRPSASGGNGNSAGLYLQTIKRAEVYIPNNDGNNMDWISHVQQPQSNKVPSDPSLPDCVSAPEGRALRQTGNPAIGTITVNQDTSLPELGPL